MLTLKKLASWDGGRMKVYAVLRLGKTVGYVASIGDRWMVCDRRKRVKKKYAFGFRTRQAAVDTFGS